MLIWWYVMIICPNKNITNQKLMSHVSETICGKITRTCTVHGPSVIFRPVFQGLGNSWLTYSCFSSADEWCTVNQCFTDSEATIAQCFSAECVNICPVHSMEPAESIRNSIEPEVMRMIRTLRVKEIFVMDADMFKGLSTTLANPLSIFLFWRWMEIFGGRPHWN